LRQIGFLLLPASAATAVLAEPIIRLLYERGEFTPDQTPVVAGALAAFSLGLAANGMMLMLTRGFFSLQSPWTPTAVALGNLALNVVLYAALYRVGVWGIPLAISLANIATAVLLLVLLRRRLDGIDFAETARSLARAVAASAVLAGVAFAVWYGVDATLGRGFLGQLASVSLALAAGGTAYLLAAWALGSREIQALHSLRGRFRRA
ncbi:MAG: polysaccharide biosynthesis C-terminal domain-containing protein, partial [Actinobacteria bacterium]|nr:polysaccharide biosynthesis C-terminal domain-containing protein [Actinomycetota bacterium]